MEERVINQKQLAEILGVDRSTVYLLERDGKIPPRRNITGSRGAWLWSEIKEWLHSRPQLVPEN